jgi:hypothetical protein
MVSVSVARPARFVSAIVTPANGSTDAFALIEAA